MRPLSVMATTPAVPSNGNQLGTPWHRCSTRLGDTFASLSQRIYLATRRAPCLCWRRLRPACSMERADGDTEVADLRACPACALLYVVPSFVPATRAYAALSVACI